MQQHRVGLVPLEDQLRGKLRLPQCARGAFLEVLNGHNGNDNGKGDRTAGRGQGEPSIEGR